MNQQLYWPPEQKLQHPAFSTTPAFFFFFFLLCRSPERILATQEEHFWRVALRIRTCCACCRTTSARDRALVAAARAAWAGAGREVRLLNEKAIDRLAFNSIQICRIGKSIAACARSAHFNRRSYRQVSAKYPSAVADQVASIVQAILRTGEPIQGHRGQWPTPGREAEQTRSACDYLRAIR